MVKQLVEHLQTVSAIVKSCEGHICAPICNINYLFRGENRRFIDQTSSAELLSDLTWVQTVCKDKKYQNKETFVILGQNSSGKCKHT